MNDNATVVPTRQRSRSAMARPAWSLIALALLSLLGVAMIGTPSRAQGLEKQGYVERSQPEVQIVVAPLPTGQWAVSSVYPASVDHAVSGRRIKQLLSLTGWKATPTEFEDRGLELKRNDGKPINRRSQEDREAPADPVMSSVTFATPANVVDLAGGTIDLTPFALAFDDLSHVNVVFLIPASLQFQFRGLRHFNDPHLSLELTSGQGTYTYLMNIKDHGMTKLQLPKYEPAVATESSAGASRYRSKARSLQTALVVVLAGIVGVMVYLWATRLIAGNSSSSRG